MRITNRLWILLILLAGCSWQALAEEGEGILQTRIDIPYTKHVLKNGMTLIVHEDHKAPIVAVNLWYHVGSKNEAPGKTGFAHLFEHLMFSGSENFKGSGDQSAFFEVMERIGATDLNGTTSHDRTDYFENVPTNALDLALWIESDRMGHLLGAIDQAKLDTQRGVVQNEKRQYENEPYGITDELITKGTTPPGHPYSWTVIGSMDDLNAASLEDVRTWFRTYYGAANTVLVLAGDITPETAIEKVEHYFGDIPAGPPVARFEKWIPRMQGMRRQRVSDRVPQARLYMVWNVPGYGEMETTHLELASSVLTLGKTSRLYKRLVYDEQIATDVTAFVDDREISGQFVIIATAQPGEGLGPIEKSINQELEKLLAEGPTERELSRVKAQRIAQFVRGAERIGGFGGKSDILAMNQTFRGSPDFYKTNLHYLREARETDVRQAARKWLTDQVYLLEVHPYGSYETNSVAADRSKMPVPGQFPEVKFPDLQRARLANGINLVLAERHAVPVVLLTMQVDAGFAADQFAIPGTARMAMSMLDEGTTHRTALQISEELGLLGASLGAGSELDFSMVSLSALKSTLDPALEIFADVILNPSFPESDFKRLQQQLIAVIQQEKAQPLGIATRVFPRILYGPDHAYSNPLSGSGTVESVARLTPADMKKFHETWFKANNATLLIVGDTTLEEITPKIERLFAKWQTGEVPSKNIGEVKPPKAATIYLIDRPGSIQSIILAGHATLPKANPIEPAIEAMNTILGGAFSSRINLNLREDKHWSYGAGTFLPAARGPRPFIAYAPVQSDKTRESMTELSREFRDILGHQPITPDELAKAQESLTLQLPGQWETMSAVAGTISEIVGYRLPEDYVTTYPDKIRSLSIEEVIKAARVVIQPDQMVWVVVGDRGQVEGEIRKLGWADIQIMDADGQRMK